MSNVTSIGGPSASVSCRPQLLDAFARASSDALDDLRAVRAEVSAAWSAAAAGCDNLPAPPAAELLGISSRAAATDQFVRDTSTRFRRAGMEGLVGTWSARALLTYAWAGLWGEPIPSVRPGWQMIGFGTEGRGRLIEVRGDLATATHIVVLVPGMTNELANVDRDLRPRSQLLYDQLVALAGPGERVAVVMWLGYRNPNMFEAPLAATSFMARSGAPALNEDLASLRVAGTTANITVVAHSYGTVLAGEAMDRTLPADRLVVVGSPGMNAPSRNALGSPDVEVFASSVGGQPSKPIRVLRAVVSTGNVNPVAGIGIDIATGKDWAASTSRIGAHGADPATSRFGSTVFRSDGSGHGAYFEPGSLGLANIALISLGRAPVPDQQSVPRRSFPPASGAPAGTRGARSATQPAATPGSPVPPP